MWRYYGRLFFQCWKDGAAWARDNIAVACVMSILPGLATWLRDTQHPLDLPLVRTIVEVYIAFAVLYFLAHLLRSPWKMDAEVGEKSKHLAMKVASLEQERAEKRPLIAIYATEALIFIDQLAWNAADVFIDVNIENRNPATPFLPTRYELRLEFPDKPYCSNLPLADVSTYQVCDCFQFAVDDRLVWQYEGQKPLTDLVVALDHSNPIVYGVPRRGWMHFYIDGLPTWPKREEETGAQVWESDVVEEDGETVSLGQWVPETRTVKSARHVKVFHLTAYVQEGSRSTFSGSFNHSGRRRISKIPKNA